MERGRFITFEGGEGTGKSTQTERLANRLASIGLDILVTREPGGSEGAEMIRPLLVSGHYPWDVRSEYLLFSAARSDHVSKVILPAIESGTWVICDRYFDSSLVYQGIVQGLDRRFMHAVYKELSCGLYPDMTLVFDSDVHQALKRVEARHTLETRFEQKGVSFHEKVRLGFLQLIDEEPERLRRVNADQTVDLVAEDVYTHIKNAFKHDFERAKGAPQ